jgi:hypothetical protein
VRYYLAQLNIARLQAPLESPQLAEFVAALEPVNALADAAPGFVWRLQTDEGDATSIRPFDDDMLLVNMSVWESLESLASFVYRSDHKDVMRRRRQWFDCADEVYLVLWWVPAGTVPTVEDSKARLETLRRAGPSAEAFTVRVPFPAPGADGAPAPALAPDSVADDWLCPT